MAKANTNVGLLRYQLKPLGWFKPNPRNARTHEKSQVEALAKSLNAHGMPIPIFALGSGLILAGHGRVAAAELAGWTEAPALIAPRHWSEEQARAYMLADNKIASLAGWDDERLREELTALDGYVTGFSDAEVMALLKRERDGKDAEAAPEPPASPRSERGDIWLCGGHLVMCGDATNADDVGALLAGKKPTLMVTDPPYGVNYDASWRDGVDLNLGKKLGEKGSGRALGKVANDDRADWREAWALFPGDVAYVWHGGLHVTEVEQSLVASGFEPRAQMIWVKQHFVFSRGDYHWQHEPCWYVVRKGKPGRWAGDRKQTTVWEIPNNNPMAGGGEEKFGHSTQKPIECMARPMRNSSRAGELAYDPFLGSGTTLIAAELEGRRCAGMEVNPAYVDVAVSRWQQFTDEEAVSIDGEPFNERQKKRAARRRPAVSKGKRAVT